jgi:Helicase HerA, central domain
MPGRSSGAADRATLVAPGKASQVIARARVGFWYGARGGGESGVEAADGCVAYSVFEVPAVPDFSSPRFPDLAQLDEAQRIKRVGERQNQFLAGLHSLGPFFGVSLRYYCTQPASQEGRIRIFLIGRSFAQSETTAIEKLLRFRELVIRLFPAEYSLLDLQHPDESVSRAALSLEGIESVAEILKAEQVIAPWHNREDQESAAQHNPALHVFSFYYLPIPFAVGENDMVELCRSLVRDTRGHPIIVDLTLVPTAPLTEAERSEMGRWLQICDQWGRGQRLEVGGGLYSEPSLKEFLPDPHAREVHKGYSDLLQRYGSPQAKCFLYAFRVLWGKPQPPDEAAESLAALALAPNSGHQIFRIGRADPAFGKALASARFCYITPAVCNVDLWKHPEAPETIRRLHRMVDVREAAGFFRLPIPGRDGCPGIPLDAGILSQNVAPDDTGQGIQVTSVISIGRFVEGQRVTRDFANFAPKDLTKHCLIAGTPGSGKTTLCLSLLCQLWERFQIPFLVLEPAKTEYRALLRVPGIRDALLLFSVGDERISPFRLNPFEVMDGIGVAEHISALLACFAGAFNLWDPLPMIFDEAVRRCYAERGWSEYAAGGEQPGLEPPTMEDLYRTALNVAAEKSYQGETRGSIRGALETRLGTLVRGPKGRCLNARRSVPVRLLLKRPVILELDALNEEEKALFMMFILMLVREYAKERPRTNDQELEHVVLLEEAHNVIGRGEGRARSDHRGDPKGEAARFFVRMLAEVRALGEGIVIVDQLPTAIAPEAMKNTNIKVMHRLVAADDRAELGATMVLDPAQLQEAAILPSGCSFVYLEGWPRSRAVQEPDFKGQQGLEKPPTDEEVRDVMVRFPDQPEVRASYLPYTDCPQICQRCDARVREHSERWAEKKLPLILRETRGLPKSARENRAYLLFVRDFGVISDLELGWKCAMVHMNERVLPRLEETDI